MASSKLSKTIASDLASDDDKLRDFLRNLFDGKSSIWNQGILSPNLIDECSGVETNPPSPDVDPNQSTQAFPTESGQDKYVISPFALASEQQPDSASRDIQGHVTTSSLSYSQTNRSTQNTGGRPAKTYTPVLGYKSTQVQHNLNRDQLSPTPKVDMIQLSTAAGPSLSTTPVLTAEEMEDIDNINISQLLPFQAYTDQSQSVNEMIVRNATHVLSATGNPNEETHVAQPTLQTLESTNCSSSEMTRDQLNHYPETTATTQQSTQGHLTTEPQSGKHVDSSASVRAQDVDLLSLLNTLIQHTSQNDVAGDGVSSDGASSAANMTTCLTPLAAGSAYLETTYLETLLCDDIKPQPEIQKAATAALDSKSVSPFIKEGLKTKIQLKRLRRGQKELQVSFENRPVGEPSEEEKRKINRRKAMNRKSANQSRINRQNWVKQLKQEIGESETENANLKEEIVKLKQEILGYRLQLSMMTRT